MPVGSDGPQVAIANEQVDVAVDEEALYRLAQLVASELYRGHDGELSLVLVDEATIAELNERFRGVAGPTDVLSFVIDETDQSAGLRVGWPGEPPEVLLGDVVICPAVARANAPEHAGDRGHRGTVADELALLVVQGICHLRGFDHEVEAEAERMEALEEDLLRRYWRPMETS
jgi:probable rRNA maturation factor